MPKSRPWQRKLAATLSSYTLMNRDLKILFTFLFFSDATASVFMTSFWPLNRNWFDKHRGIRRATKLRNSRNRSLDSILSYRLVSSARSRSPAESLCESFSMNSSETTLAQFIIGGSKRFSMLRLSINERLNGIQKNKHSSKRKFKYLILFSSKFSFKRSVSLFLSVALHLSLSLHIKSKDKRLQKETEVSARR